MIPQKTNFSRQEKHLTEARERDWNKVIWTKQPFPNPAESVRSNHNNHKLECSVYQHKTEDRQQRIRHIASVTLAVSDTSLLSVSATTGQALFLENSVSVSAIDRKKKRCASMLPSTVEKWRQNIPEMVIAEVRVILRRSSIIKQYQYMLPQTQPQAQRSTTTLLLLHQTN